MGINNIGQNKGSTEALKCTILNDLYHIIGESVNANLYSFKGGYILEKKVGSDIRRTSDLDMTVLNSNTFELVTLSISRYLKNLKEKGVIWDYSIKSPKIVGNRNVSGYVKLYVKPHQNIKKRVLCGIDISIHRLDEGIELSFEGYPQYSNELMLADKVSALYSDEKNVIRRIRDVLDIFLILSISNKGLNKQLILRKIKERGVNILQISRFEILAYCEPSKVDNAIYNLLDEGDRISITYLTNNNISVQLITSKVCYFLSILRKG